ncbi:hypothetical protein A2Z22_03105 [Candidatus Woesebacteria bacterium RBG_16_34_12]|uniref:Uncharacterized protein n=1 Tax=Candidatus Woesebacteria bacterium RBG_16_34_12 TaxID=1802480 RepID=A0A1F7X6Z1_9BACT|nr:MAG: hypothetical protein A2Z22_03105 [Candidatus Woesebacteria bacterium RBG_16_34_12]
MKKIIVVAVLLVVFLIGVVFFLRLVIGGPEDTWICVNGEWVKHGNPSSPKPDMGCGSKIVEQTKQELEDISRCLSASGSMMDYQEAKGIASEVCSEGKLKEEHFCNGVTGTWWIDFEPNEIKEGCNPACVVNIETKQAEINWRCTGLIEPSI